MRCSSGLLVLTRMLEPRFKLWKHRCNRCAASGFVDHLVVLPLVLLCKPGNVVGMHGSTCLQVLSDRGKTSEQQPRAVSVRDLPKGLHEVRAQVASLEAQLRHSGDENSRLLGLLRDARSEKVYSRRGKGHKTRPSQSEAEADESAGVQNGKQHADISRDGLRQELQVRLPRYIKFFSRS
jgi:hypothetical protein